MWFGKCKYDYNTICLSYNHILKRFEWENVRGKNFTNAEKMTLVAPRWTLKICHIFVFSTTIRMSSSYKRSSDQLGDVPWIYIRVKASKARTRQKKIKGSAKKLLKKHQRKNNHHREALKKLSVKKKMYRLLTMMKIFALYAYDPCL